MTAMGPFVVRPLGGFGVETGRLSSCVSAIKLGSDFHFNAQQHGLCLVIVFIESIETEAIDEGLGSKGVEDVRCR